MHTLGHSSFLQRDRTILHLKPAGDGTTLHRDENTFPVLSSWTSLCTGQSGYSHCFLVDEASCFLLERCCFLEVHFLHLVIKPTMTKGWVESRFLHCGRILRKCSVSWSVKVFYEVFIHLIWKRSVLWIWNSVEFSRIKVPGQSDFQGLQKRVCSSTLSLLLGDNRSRCVLKT